MGPKKNWSGEKDFGSRHTLTARSLVLPGQESARHWCLKRLAWLTWPGWVTTACFEFRWSAHKLCQGCVPDWLKAPSNIPKLFSPAVLALMDKIPIPQWVESSYNTMGRTPILQWVEFPRKKAESAWNDRAINLKVPGLHHTHCNTYVWSIHYFCKKLR